MSRQVPDRGDDALTLDERLFIERVNQINSFAELEGWAIFDIGHRKPVFQIQREDESNVFAGDEEAIAHIKRLADAGSKLHRLALQMTETP